MSSPTAPLLWGAEPEFNVITLDTPPNFSRHTTWLARPATSHISHHKFRKTQHTNNLNLTPDANYKRIRRKPSLINLSDQRFVRSPSPLAVISATPLRHTHSDLHLVPTPLVPTSTAFEQHHNAESPSLSSSVDTIESTPTQVAYCTNRSFNQQCEDYQRIGESELIRTKRKFPIFKPAKRLPQRGCCGEDVGDWFVYAAVVDRGVSDLDDFGGDEEVFDSESEDAELEETAEEEEKDEDLFPRRGRSVRFAEVEPEKASRKVSDWPPKSIPEERDPASESTITLSKFQFPTPPGDRWAGTFGHLPEETPPTSPTTLHYRGASFDLVNPHASLLLGVKDFETPGEIDGLLDDYFSRQPPYTPNRTNMEAMMPSQPEETANGSAGRRFRTLYGDADSARRNIMRLPSPPTHDPNSQSRQDESPLATDGRDADLQTDVTGEGHEDADNIVRSCSQGQLTEAGEHTSSDEHCSSFSDPFDLHISDDEGDRRVNNIDAVIFSANPQIQQKYNDEAKEDFAVYDDVQHAGPTASLQETDSTLGHIVEQYEHTEAPAILQSAVRSDRAAPSSTEYGLPPHATFRRQDTVSTYNFGLSHAYSYSEADDHGYYYRIEEDGPLSARHLSAVAYSSTAQVRPSFVARRNAIPYPAEQSDVPTSEQTYGQTSQLLQITPRSVPASQQPRSGDIHHRQTRGAIMGNYDDPSGNKENVSPSIPRQWSDADLPRARRSYAHDTRNLQRTLVRSSSHYPDDDADWEDTQASGSRTNLAHGPNRISTLSYADTSDHDSIYRSSVSAPQGIAGAIESTDQEKTSELNPFGSDAHYSLMLGQNETPRVPAAASPARRAKELIMKKLRRDYVLTMQSENSKSFLPAETAQHRRDAAELESIRKEHPSVVRHATEQATNEFQQEQAMAPEMSDLTMPTMPTKPKRVYRPQDSFEKVAQLALRKDNQSMNSETRGLLGGSESPYGQHLQYSETIGTFQTHSQGTPSVPDVNDYVSQAWSPLPPRTYMMSGALGNITPASTIRTGNANEYEMIPVTRTGRARLAMRSQTSLRPIALGESVRKTTRRAFTDSELIEAEPRWNMYKSTDNGSPSTRTRLRVPLPVHPTSRPSLLSVEEARYPQRIYEQENLSSM